MENFRDLIREVKMKAMLVLLLTFLFVCGCSQVNSVSSHNNPLTDGITVDLWPVEVVGDSSKPREAVKPSEGDNIIRLTDINIPSMTVYKAAAESPTPAVLVCPGGGYWILAIDLEGTEIAQWLNSIGVTAVVLKYRVPNNRDGAFADVQRTMSLIRHNAEEWNIDAGRVGIIGFSAGANLAGKLSCNFKTKSYDHIDEADKLSCRPDFAMLIYPYLLGEDEKLDSTMNVTSETPNTILIHAQDDSVKAESSIYYFLALKEAKVASELHIFPTGGHGYGLRPSEHAVSGWPKLCTAWMKKTGILK
jgi:acetyl esterase/lipase